MKKFYTLFIFIIFLVAGKESISQVTDTSRNIGLTPVKAEQWTDNYITKWMYNEASRSENPVIGNSIMLEDEYMIIIWPGPSGPNTERLKVNGSIGLYDLLDFKTPESQINWGEGTLSFTSTSETSSRGEIPPEPASLKTIMTLNGDNGNVGIGTAEPSAALEVVTDGSQNAPSIISTANVNHKLIIVPFLGEGGLEQKGSFNYLARYGDAGLFWSDGTGSVNNEAGLVIAPNSLSQAGIRIDKLGNVGIGVKNPSAKLHVNGTTLTRNTITEYLKITTDFSVGAVLTSDDEGNGSWRQPEVTQSLWTASENSDNIYRLDGNVGIGTSNPDGYKLAVNGHIVAELIKVKADVPGADYVFLEDYKLMSLYELETFVNKNHHLPEVKSAKEFKEEGYYLGEMDDVLLRKVEELTLYTIEQQKQLDAQSQIIKEFEKQLMELKQQITK